MIRRVRSRTGAELPALGQGTWRMGEDRRQRAREVLALQTGLALGLPLVDTAEMYGSGGVEEVVPEAIAGRRDEVFLVSKVLPQNATRGGTIRAAEASLRRLRTDRLDLYLLHWPGSHPLAGTLEAFAQLAEQGKVLHFGVSNFDLAGLEEAEALAGGDRNAANQVLYNLERRAAEGRVLPFCAARGIVVMAYSPIAQGRMKRSQALARIARRHDVRSECVAIAWTMREPGVVTIPKSANPEHVRENARAAELALTPQDLTELERDFPRAPRDAALETL